jgi:hypothetical protein
MFPVINAKWLIPRHFGTGSFAGIVDLLDRTQTVVRPPALEA